MLRGKPENQPAPEPGPASPAGMAAGTGFPGMEPPFATGEHPPGVLFYHARESFWLPYHLLQAMEFKADQLRLVFAADDIVITGRGLHPLYLELALQTVSRVLAQGERYAAVSEAATFILRIDRIPRPTGEQQQQELDREP